MSSFLCNCVVLCRFRSFRWTDPAFKEAYRLCKIPSNRTELWYSKGQRMLKRENNFIQLLSSKSVEHSRRALIITELVNWTHSVEHEVLYRVRRRPWLTPVTILPLNEYVIKSEFDVFPSASRYCKWYFPFTPSGQNFYVPFISCIFDTYLANPIFLDSFIISRISDISYLCSCYANFSEFPLLYKSQFCFANVTNIF
jgi:hypothetical protein